MIRTVLTTLLTLAALSGHAATDTWETTGPLATGVNGRVINALAVSADGHTVYAGTGAGSVFQYVIPTYAVTATASPVAGGTVSCTPNPVNQGSSSTCTASANAGYGFAGWTGDCAGSNPICTLSNITAAKNSIATFKNTPTIALVANPPLKAVPGSVVQLTAIVSGPAGTPGGTVTFFNGAMQLSPATPLASGAASYATNTLPGSPMPLVLRVEYAGDSLYMPGMQAMPYLVSEKTATLTSLSTAPNPSEPGVGVTATARVLPTYPSPATIGGTVTVSSGDGPSCLITLPATQCTLTLAATGRRTITATYSGDGNFSASNASVQHRVGKTSIVPILDMLLD